jgi:fatty-acid desaturase
MDNFSHEIPVKTQSVIPRMTSAPRRRGLLAEPTYGWGETVPRQPSFREIMVEWIDAVNFFQNRTRLLIAVFPSFHFATGIVFLFWAIYHFSIVNLALVFACTVFLSLVYTTLWNHRYCTHRAFKFRHPGWTNLFLWTNPMFFREESWVIPHHVHHSRSDRIGDPYGPHLGRLGSYLAYDSSAKTNLDISRSDYERLARSLQHIGFRQNSFEQFQRTGSVECEWYFVTRAAFATLFWCLLAYLVGGNVGVLVWLSSVFLFAFGVRDFAYRGHSGFFVKAMKGHSQNQFITGLLTGEWHDNHHEHPRLAHAGLAWWQVDIPFWMIRAMAWCGIIGEINTLKNYASDLRQNP